MLALFAMLLNATIVDRIAITAGNQAITDSEIEQRIRLSAFESGEKPVFDTAARRKAADNLIDEKLIEHEMEVGHYPRLSAEARKKLMADYAALRFRTGSMDQALAAEGVKRQELEDDLARQSDLLTFLSLRFRPAIQVTDADVRTYYDSMPHGEARLEDLRTAIEQAITNKRADLEMDAWVKDQRRRTKIQYLEKDLAP